MKVLIVDDNSDDRKLLRLNLERHGCGQVIEARDGQEGFELAREHRPDLIISDALMPRMDGFEFLRMVKTDEELKSTPFVFHSSVYTGLKDEELASNLGAEAFITKPKAPDDFWREISIVLERLATGKKTPPPSGHMAEEKEYLREYSEVVAAKLEQKVRELEESLAQLKETENALRKSEWFLSNVIENIPDMIFVKDAQELRFISFNRAGEELLGYSREELTGKNDYDISSSHEADFSTGNDREILRNGKLVDIPEETIRTRNKGVRILHTKKIPVQDEAGATQYLLGISEDITDRKKLEEQLRHSQKMEAIGTLTGGIAHDFNNILTAIIGFGSILEMKMAKDDPLLPNVTQILAASERATKLTRSLLSFSRKESIQAKPVDLNVIISSVELMLRRLIREDFDLQITTYDGDLTIMADSGQIEQVLVNLTTNSRDAMPSGGSIAITTEQVMLNDDFSKSHGFGERGLYALLVFADNGEGMDKDTQQHIFDPFFTTKEVGKGSGLGLSICYGIIKQHKGYIFCSSEPGRGTTFRIYLPITQTDLMEPAVDRKSHLKGGTETILLAEDDMAVRTLTATILADFGYQVITAEDGNDAVERFRKQQGEIDLCLFDVIMPKKSGAEAFEEIVNMRPDARVLFMSGYPAGVPNSNGISRAMIDLIPKPVIPHELLRRVREILDR